MTVKLTGMGNLSNAMKRTIKNAERRVVDLRREVAHALVKELIENIPVWSGKTVRGVRVSNSEGGDNAREPHPDRRDYAKDGKWESHTAEWGDTKNMSIGQEPNRASAEAIALSTVGATNYSMDRKVYVSANSYIWAEIDSATYRGSESRGDPVISRLAVEQIKANFKGRVK